MIENAIYNRLFSFKSTPFKIIISLLIPALISIHVASRISSMNYLYMYFKCNTARMDSQIWKIDPYLSHRGKPNASGQYHYYIDYLDVHGTVPVYLDSLGYRTVPNHLKITSDSLNLYLGCSFTFGDYIEAQNSYSYLSSKKMGYNYINAGASAYGFGQMKQQVDTLLTKYKFKYIFIQLSPWLADRAMHLKGFHCYGYHPYPYFSENKDGFSLNYPHYPNLLLESKPSKIRDTKTSYKEKLSFYFSDGYKMEIRNYYIFQWVKLKTLIGLSPRPTKNKLKLEKYFYDYVIDIAKEHHATPVVLKIWDTEHDCDEIVNYLAPKVKIINLDKAVNEVQISSGCSSKELFSIYHKEKNDSIIIDGHPNKLANCIFAETIYSELK